MSLMQVEQITEEKGLNSPVFENNGVLHCSFDTFDYPFSKKPTKHFTRTHALLFITQATYLLVTILSEHDKLWPIGRNEAIDLASCEQMTFTSISLNFKKFIKNENGISLVISMSKYRVIDNKLFGHVEFEFERGCYGSCKGIIAIDGSMKII